MFLIREWLTSKPQATASKQLCHRCRIRVVVSDNIGDKMLIAYQDLLKFNVIHTNFPYEVLTYTVTADVPAKIKHCFSDVLSDDLNPTPMKTPTPMTISLKENSNP